MSPPDLPPRAMYKTLGSLLQHIEQGNRFHPVTVKDVAAALKPAKVGSLLSSCGFSRSQKVA